MNLYEKLNRLDDSIVESKRIIKNKKLTESSEKTRIEVKFEPYARYEYEPVKIARVSGKDLLDALLKMTDKMRLYVDSYYAAEYEENHGVELTADALLERIAEENGDGCDFIFYIKNLTTGEMLFESEYEEIEDWDDDIDEMLTEAMPKQRPARSLGYSYGIADIKDYAKRLLANTNIHEQNKMIEELVGGARITSAQVDDLVARLTAYSQSLHKYIDSSRADSDVQTLLDEIKDLSI